MKHSLISTLQPHTLKQLRNVLLNNRAVSNEDVFFSPPHPNTISSTEVGIASDQLQRAVEYLKEAITEKKKIVIYGDYDADGITATAVLWQALHAAGASAVPFIPRRDVHGYGLSERGINEIAESQQPAVIVTVDNGIVALPALRHARSLGIDVIISDHHQPEVDAKLRKEVESLAVAIVHTTQLCGAGVAWFLGRELSQESTDLSLDLVGIATVADQVPLLNWNRLMAIHGIQALKETRRPGLLALADSSQMLLSEASERMIGFQLAPKINAMGRLAHGLDALRLLCTSSTQRAYQLAQVLNSTNVDRQEMTQSQYELALTIAREQSQRSVIVVAHQEFHEGVVGLIAGRLTEELKKPAFVLTINNGFAKGSARSVPGVNVVALLRRVRSLLIDVGGHPMAAGFSLDTARIDEFNQALDIAAVDHITSENLEIDIQLECSLGSGLLQLKTAAMIAEFAPFGTANAEPHFLLSDAVFHKARVFGKNAQHLGCTVQTSDGESREVLCWSQAELFERLPQSGQPINCAISLSANTWKNKTTLQLTGYLLE